MSAPALIYLALMFLGLGNELSKNGKPKTGKYSFWGQIVGCGIACGLLYWGGFFAARP